MQIHSNISKHKNLNFYLLIEKGDLLASRVESPQVSTPPSFYGCVGTNNAIGLTLTIFAKFLLTFSTHEAKGIL